MKSTFRSGLAVVSMGAFAVGCSSAASPPTSPSGFSGVYVTDTPGAIRQLEFVDASHVNVWWASCADGKPCEANDTYVASGSDLTIHDPAGNDTRLQLNALQEGAGTAYDPHVLDTSLGGEGGPAALTSGDGGSLSAGQPVTLVITFQLTIVVQTGGGSLPSNDAGPSGVEAGAGGDGGVALVTCAGTALTQTFRRANVDANDQQAFDFFRGRGLTAAQAAGIVGNLEQESNDDPACYQSASGCSSTAHAGYPGVGIAQWSRGGRWDTLPNDNVTWYAMQQGEPASSLNLQLEFIWYELANNPSYGLSQLQQQTTASGASDVFASQFEACGRCVQGNREANAQNVYDAFANDSVSAGEGGVCAQSFGGCTASQRSGSCVDTGVCATQNGMSTPGTCPGPSNIQCCTL